MSEKLKPCPFCGGDAKMYNDCDTFLGYVYCPKCRGRAGYECQTNDEAIAAWNKRTNT